MGNRLRPIPGSPPSPEGLGEGVRSTRRQLLWMSGLILILAVLGFGSLLNRTVADGAAPPLETNDEKKPCEPATTSSVSDADSASDGEDDGAILDPLGPNAACYVCHMTFVHEELSRIHLAEKITCIKCHGLSAAHANDEEIGATPPDVTFSRSQIDTSCEKCHEKHDVPARDVVARWLERKIRKPVTVCTDCHGMHRIEQSSEDDGPEEVEQQGTERTEESIKKSECRMPE